MSVDIVILNVSDILCCEHCNLECHLHFMSVDIVILNAGDILCLWTL